MTDWRQEVINTYDKSADKLAEYFRGIGSRSKDINLALELAGNPKNPKVIEIGCGDGRDAKTITQKTTDYVGFDISKELIKLAKSHVPKAKFVVGNAADFDYGHDVDIIFAFASLLHSPQDEVKLILDKASKALKPGGIFYISLKYAPQYESKVKTDQFGRRTFFFYNAELIQDLAGEGYKTLKNWRETRGDTVWFEIVLQKR